MFEAVTLDQIEKIFAVIEQHGISREAVVIPLRPGHPGRVTRLKNGKVEIVVDSEVPLDEWLPFVDAEVGRLVGGG